MMSCYQILMRLKDSGELHLLMREGLISYKSAFYLDVTQHFDILLKKGYKRRDAVYECAYKFGRNKDKPLANSTVYRAINAMGYGKNGVAYTNTSEERAGSVPEKSDKKDKEANEAA